MLEGYELSDAIRLWWCPAAVVFFYITMCDKQNRSLISFPIKCSQTILGSKGISQKRMKNMKCNFPQITRKEVEKEANPCKLGSRNKDFLAFKSLKNNSLQLVLTSSTASGSQLGHILSTGLSPNTFFCMK